MFNNILAACTYSKRRVEQGPQLIFTPRKLEMLLINRFKKLFYQILLKLYSDISVQDMSTNFLSTKRQSPNNNDQKQIALNSKSASFKTSLTLFRLALF